MKPSDPLGQFLLPVAHWFRSALGEPTAAQAQAWPSIAVGQHTLILAPTGSGKTLAAFLACLDGLWRQPELKPGVRVLYVSPLRALNNDIFRNLQVPLEGVTRAAQDMGMKLPTLDVAVRTGDTPAAERRRLLRKPPHILITTPESLHLLLTSRAREALRSVTHCIVDEIHSLCPNKRGVFMALLLERLAALTTAGFVRIGLSATQRPLEEVARFLGGQDDGGTPRSVAIIDGGLRKDLDLRVVMPVEKFGALPERSIWPSIYRLLGSQIEQHRSTIVFANNRRGVERITAALNDANGPESPPVARAHHGSISLEVREETEKALKEGRLPAVVSTASLELGIDMGAVDLVCQVESPGNIARGLQRVGRAGHLVGQRSKGRLIPKMPGDLLEQAVLAREMVAGNVEPLRVPANCLDVLAQQIVAMVAVDSWDVTDLFRVVRRAYPFRDLTPQVFDTVLQMLSGRYRFQPATAIGSSATIATDHSSPLSPLAGRGVGGEGKTAEPAPLRAGQTLTALQPRISWDRVNQRLLAMPGSQHLALLSGGTIPDTGQYAVYTNSGVRIGELDEEFIYERRVGDTFLLGTTPWRLDQIEKDRVIVLPAAAAPAMVPFWRGEQAGRSLELGQAMGRFLGELTARLDDPECLPWLQRECHLDAAAAQNLREYVRRQRDRDGEVPTDKQVVVEASRDQLGDWQVILLSTLGNRVHLGLRLALEHRLRERLGFSPQILHHNNGLLIRLTDSPEPVLDILQGITPENVRERIVEELADSALFALRFRQNAARALLLPRLAAGKRAPLWLQRIRGRDLLQVARRHADFPIVVETFRECLQDHLDLGQVEKFLTDVRDGSIQVATCCPQSPSPFAQDLLFAFTAAFMYEFNGTDAEPGSTPSVDNRLLDELLGTGKAPLIHPQAVAQVEGRLRGIGRPPRSATEMAEWLLRLGDLAPEELHGPMAGFLAELENDSRAVEIDIPSVDGRDCRSGKLSTQRWVLAEEADLYHQAFEGRPANRQRKEQAAETILQRFLDTHALVGLDDILRRYPLEESWACKKLELWAESGRAVAVPPSNGADTARWSAPANLEQVQRGTLSLLRREVATSPSQQFADYLMRWQYAHPDSRRGGLHGASEVLARLEGFSLPAELWEQAVIPARVAGAQPSGLDECLASGQWLWAGAGDECGSKALFFLQRDHLAKLPCPVNDNCNNTDTGRVLECLRTRGALFVPDIASGLGMLPGAVRTALWELVRQGYVSNDRYDPVRRGEQPIQASTATSRSIARARLRPPLVPEGRWSLVPWGRPDGASHALFLTRLLLERYGIVARELAAMDARMLPWRVLYEVLSRLEMTGEVRRGYFVEGLSGAQFALPDAARLLQEVGQRPTAKAPAVLLHSLDPANLYGSSAPLDIGLLDGDTRPFLRRLGNWLVLRAGQPILIIEQQGKRLTALASASRDDLAAAVACLPAILGSDRQHRLTVSEWNGQPVAVTAGRELLETIGFVRDYQAMTLYGGWK
jgi:ATP-dependent helicase Lhr and Lhr-like helicase